MNLSCSRNEDVYIVPRYYTRLLFFPHLFEEANLQRRERERERKENRESFVDALRSKRAHAM